MPTKTATLPKHRVFTEQLDAAVETCRNFRTTYETLMTECNAAIETGHIAIAACKAIGKPVPRAISTAVKQSTAALAKIENWMPDESKVQKQAKLATTEYAKVSTWFADNEELYNEAIGGKTRSAGA